MKWDSAVVFVGVLFSYACFVQAVEDADVETTTVKSVEIESKQFSQEVECSRFGGICIQREGCPPDKVSKDGECPNQKEMGAVCCHSLSTLETRCHSLGGHCRESCPENLVLSQSNDCESGETCCSLV